MGTATEICYFIDYKTINRIDLSGCNRIYFGHETCEKLLPEFDEISDILKIVEKKKLELTFVTPFLTENGIAGTIFFINQLIEINPKLEIVTSDWGLLNYLCVNKIGIPVVSRFLTGQQTDFRLLRLEKELQDKVLKINNKYFKLTHKQVSPELTEHISSCALLKSSTLQLFENMGITRFELSNVFQSAKLPDNKRFNYSLHVPFVPLTIFKTCPDNLDFNQIKGKCNKYTCNKNHSAWTNKDLEHEIFCIDNALYYQNIDYQEKIESNSSIDRIVFRKESE